LKVKKESSKLKKHKMKVKFSINYDDQLDDAVNKISDALKSYGLIIDYDEDEENSGDGIQSYEIFKIND